MADRKKGRSPNNILYYKPNQYPSARFGNIKWSSDTTTKEDLEQNDEPVDTDPDGRLEYLRNRFNSPDSGPASGIEGSNECPSCAERPNCQ